MYHIRHGVGRSRIHFSLFIRDKGGISLQTIHTVSVFRRVKGSGFVIRSDTFPHKSIIVFLRDFSIGNMAFFITKSGFFRHRSKPGLPGRKAASQKGPKCKTGPLRRFFLCLTPPGHGRRGGSRWGFPPPTGGTCGKNNWRPGIHSTGQRTAPAAGWSAADWPPAASAPAG